MMNEAVTNKTVGDVMAGLNLSTLNAEPAAVSQMRTTVKVLIDNLEHYAVTSPPEHAHYFFEAQRLFEMANMMAVKGLYLSQ